jgi:hypothetical protein
MCYDAHAGMCGASRVTGWAVAHPGIWGKADLYTVAVLYNATVCVCADISSLVPHAGTQSLQSMVSFRALVNPACTACLVDDDC